MGHHELIMVPIGCFKMLQIILCCCIEQLTREPKVRNLHNWVRRFWAICGQFKRNHAQFLASYVFPIFFAGMCVFSQLESAKY